MARLVISVMELHDEILEDVNCLRVWVLVIAIAIKETTELKSKKDICYLSIYVGVLRSRAHSRSYMSMHADPS